MPYMNEENEFEDCAGFEDCKRFQEDEPLDCQDCDNYLPTDCFEDYGGREPFFMKIKRRC